MEDFYQLFKGSEQFIDSEFTPDSESLYWASEGEEYGAMAAYEPIIEWGRIIEEFPRLSLFGYDGITPADVRQGTIGNCWFMAGASAVAEVPGRLEKVFLNNENRVSQTGIYGVNIYTLGVPHTIIIDDWLPLR